MRGGDHAGRAEAALQRVMLAERRLQRRQAFVERQTFDGNDLGAFGLYRQHQTGADRGAVDQHRAGAANAVLAADMGAGQPQRVAQAIGQGQARFDFDLDGLAVDFKFDGHLLSRLRLQPGGIAQRAFDHDADQRFALSAAGSALAITPSPMALPLMASSAAFKRSGRSATPIAPTWALRALPFSSS